MKRSLITVLTVLAGYALFLVATAPARLIVRVLRPSLPPALTFDAVHGSIWSGRAVLSVHHGVIHQPLTTVHFEFWPAALMHGEWGYAVQCQGPVHGHARIAAGRHQFIVTALGLSAPITALVPLWPPLTQWGLGGTLSVTSHRLQFGGGTAAGRGQLTLVQARVVSLPVAPLGNYVLAFAMTPRGLRYRLRTRQGQLQIRGAGHYRRTAGVVTFHGLIRGRGLRLSGFMSSFGKTAAHGARAVTFTVRVAPR